MPWTKHRRWISAARRFAIVPIAVGALGIAAGGLQAAPEHPAGAAVQADAARDALRGCDLGERDAKSFLVERTGGGTRTIEICNAEDRPDLPATAQALSLALDAAAATPGITADPRTLDLVSLRLMRARTDVDIRMDPDSRSRKLKEIDQEIKALEGIIQTER
jgi:hypothetical protein